MSHLNNLGPKVVTVEMFEHYKSLPPPNGQRWTVEDMFEYWTNEANPDALRILTLRDLLRQDYHNTAIDPEEDICRHTNDSYKTIIHLEDSQALPRALTGRPKLVNEFTKELLYNFEHHHMVRSAQLMATGAGDTCDHLIELFLPRVSQKMGQSLWKYHSCNPDERPHKSITSPEKLDRLISFLILGQYQNLPAWLTDKIWIKFTNLAMAEGKSLPRSEEMQIFKLSDPDTLTLYPVLISLIEWLPRSYDCSKRIDTTVKFLQLLQSAFPGDYVYVDYFDAIHIAPCIPNPQLTASFLARHLDALHSGAVTKPSREDAFDARNFLYWADGFFRHTNPNPHWPYKRYPNIIQNLLKTIDRLDYLPVY